LANSRIRLFGLEPLARAGALHYIASGAILDFGSLTGEDMKRAVCDASLEEAIFVANRKVVRAYLRRHSDLAALLRAICDAARKEFGSEAELALELYRDPEIRDSYLTLYVRLDSYDRETMARIDRVGAAFERRLAQTSGYLLLTTDFRMPRGADAV